MRKIYSASCSVACAFTLILLGCSSDPIKQKRSATLTLRDFSDAYYLVTRNYIEPLPTSSTFNHAINGLYDRAQQVRPVHPATSIDAIANGETMPDTAELRRFSDAFTKLLDQSGLAENILLEAALKGMLSGLDTRSNYLDAKAYHKLRYGNRQAGLGLNLKHVDGQVIVTYTFPGGAARRAGITHGDVLVALNDQSLSNLELATIVDRLGGKPGSSVKLEVLRGAQRIVHPKLYRMRFKPGSIDCEIIGAEILYIRPFQLTHPSLETIKDIGNLLTKSASPPQKIILDLRGNPGGIVATAVQLADLFILQGLLARIQGRTENNTSEHIAVEQNTLFRTQAMVVLVDRDTGPGAELVAAALQHHGRAIIAGETTNGDGSVQTIWPLGPGAVRLTTARILHPGGMPLSNNGVTPDLQIGAEYPTKPHALTRYSCTSADRVSSQLELDPTIAAATYLLDPM